MRRFILPILLLLLSICNSKAQVVTTFNQYQCAKQNVLFSDLYANGRDKVCATVQVSEVRIYNDYVDVVYRVVATENINKGLYLGFANNGYISLEGGVLNLPVIGQLSGNQLYNVGSENKRGWDKVEKGQEGRYILRFQGHVPEGVTEITINSGRELFSHYYTNYFCFTLRELNNPPKYGTNLTSESLIKENIINNNDGVCGIYESIESSVTYKFACVKMDGEYWLIHIDRTPKLSWWAMGDIKASLTKTPSGIYKAKWLMADKSIIEDTCWMN